MWLLIHYFVLLIDETDRESEHIRMMFEMFDARW